MIKKKCTKARFFNFDLNTFLIRIMIYAQTNKNKKKPIDNPSADLEVQLMQLNHCEGEYSKY